MRPRIHTDAIDVSRMSTTQGLVCGESGLTIELKPGREDPMATLGAQFAGETREAELYTPLDRGRVQCLACGHRCPISPGFAGVCKVRYNAGGKLLAPYGY